MLNALLNKTLLHHHLQSKSTAFFQLKIVLLKNLALVFHSLWFILLCTMISVMLSTPSFADRSTLPLATNLEQLGKQAAKANIPIALLFTSKGLKSTANLKDEAILPALYNGQLDGKVLMQEIEVNTAATTIDFYGETVANKEFKQLYNLTSLPVVVFVNSDGDEINQPLLSGAYDFYFFYLKDRINESLQALGNKARVGSQ